MFLILFSDSFLGIFFLCGLFLRRFLEHFNLNIVSELFIGLRFWVLGMYHGFAAGAHICSIFGANIKVHEKGGIIMRCELCGKTTVFGKKIAHDRMYVNNRNSRKFKPNLQTMHIETEKGRTKITACTRCLRTLRKKGLSVFTKKAL